ncbi:transcriptional regulator [Sphingomonas sp. AR_OL41]|uniref:transcriptional regulator n=1 Tax=Sphingomonas sp. AR_OL41 TaxID=3042729 RepID=UPI002480766B|nr:transcriptional regulator [Sphingomonas sp. AR_OL41]MDH7971853.1 transcriptional regulator [Sphingomonas sp. AR_OL41]
MTARLTFDPVIHAPARLQIMAVLAGVQDAEFAMLRTTADVSDSVLSKHLAALNEAGYVRLRKAALDGRQRTWVSLTRTGRTAFRDHVAALTALARVADAVDDAAVSGDLALGSV